MGILKEIFNVVSEVKTEYEQMKAMPNYVNFNKIWKIGENDNCLYLTENLKLIRYMTTKSKYLGQVKLIYIDPPFYSKADYEANLDFGFKDSVKGNMLKAHAYGDMWKEGFNSYLKMLALRLMFMRDLLSEDGTIWVHLDWHGVYYVKILMDEIFGSDNFVNDIIWTYKSGGTCKKHFARKHDNILVYSKTNKYSLDLPKEKSYNRGLKPYKFKGVEEFEDEIGWHTYVNMKDVWSIDMVGRTAKERTGYATQKPELLLKRIIETSTREGELCCDFFSGSSTMAKVCYDLNRKFICCDNSKIAFSKSLRRLIAERCDFNAYLDAAFTFTTTEAKLDGEILQALTPNEVIISVNLLEYNINIDDEIHNTKINEKMKNFLKMEPKSFVDIISIDYSLDGITFVNIANGLKPKEGVIQKVEETVNIGVNKSIYIRTKVVDIFGNLNMRVDEIPIYWNEPAQHNINNSLN